MSGTQPGSSTRAPTPSSCASRRSAASSGPAPQMRSRQPAISGAIAANARTRRSKPFWRVSRPAARITGPRSCCGGEAMGGTAFGIRATRASGPSAVRYARRSARVSTTTASAEP